MLDKLVAICSQLCENKYFELKKNVGRQVPLNLNYLPIAHFSTMISEVCYAVPLSQ